MQRVALSVVLLKIKRVNSTCQGHRIAIKWSNAPGLVVLRHGPLSTRPTSSWVQPDSTRLDPTRLMDGHPRSVSNSGCIKITLYSVSLVKVCCCANIAVTYTLMVCLWSRPSDDDNDDNGDVIQISGAAVSAVSVACVACTVFTQPIGSTVSTANICPRKSVIQTSPSARSAFLHKPYYSYSRRKLPPSEPEIPLAENRPACVIFYCQNSKIKARLSF